MKIGIKLLAVAILSLTMGIAFASPLLVTELNIRPWTNYVQGQTAQFSVNVVYANFTLQNADAPVEQDSGPTITYFAVVNITNLSDLGATLQRVEFTAAPQIDSVPTNGSVTWDAKGAWVDGKYYNLTWVDSSSPYFDENGHFVQPGFKLANPYWMQGVQISDWYVNGNVTSTYLNMNGTWTNVTGHIDVTRTPLGNAYSSDGTDVVADNIQAFDSEAFKNFGTENFTSNGTGYGSSFGMMNETDHLVGPGYFNNSWEPQQSRLIAISGSWQVLASLGAGDEPVKEIQGSNLTFMTQVDNMADLPVQLQGIVNNTVTNTLSTDVELVQVQLTQSGNSYLYNPLSLDNQAFQIDQWGVEATLRSQTP
jgi:hypothetical protein